MCFIDVSINRKDFGTRVKGWMYEIITVILLLVKLMFVIKFFPLISFKVIH